MNPKEILNFCIERGFLIDNEVLNLFNETEDLETVKLIMGIGDSLIGRLLLIDGLSMEFRVVKTKRNVNCPLCGDNPSISELIDYEEFCGIPTS